MIKTALKVYGKNVWEIFAIIGVLAIGLAAGLGIAIPAIMSSCRNTYDSVVNTVKDVAAQYQKDFNTDNFMKSLADQFKVLDWANPIATLTGLFSNNKLINIVTKALKDAGLTGDVLNAAVKSVKDTLDNFGNGISRQVWIVVISTGVGALVSYIATKIIVRFRSTRYHHAGWFILSIVLNLINLALIYFIAYLITTRITNKVGYCFALIGNGLLMYILTFLNALICYKPKEVKTSDILNIKNILLLFAANLIILTISVLIIAIVAIFSDAIAILISIPFLLIISIVTECIVISYTEQVTMYYIIKSGKPMPKELVKKDPELEFLKQLVAKEKAKKEAKKVAKK